MVAMPMTQENIIYFVAIYSGDIHLPLRTFAAVYQ
jgi:hypothetical protein